MKKHAVDYPLLGQRIHRLRIESDLSAAKMAQLLGVSVEQYSLVERGEKAPSLDVFTGICAILRVAPNDLLFGCLPEREV